MKEFSELNRNEKRWLNNRVCALCDQPLGRNSCSSMYGKCDENNRIVRMNRALKEYKPRMGAGGFNI